MYKFIVSIVDVLNISGVLTVCVCARVLTGAHTLQGSNPGTGAF